MTTPPPPTTRRTFLVATAIVAASACAPAPTAGEGEGEGEGEAGAGEGEGESSLIDCGKASDVVAGKVTKVANTGVLVGRDAGGVFAMSAFCTHLGCNLSSFDGLVLDDGDIHCGCHGSTFAPDGSVVNGPATTPLHHLRATVDADGELLVDTKVSVSADERTPG